MEMHVDAEMDTATLAISISPTILKKTSGRYTWKLCMDNDTYDVGYQVFNNSAQQSWV